MKRILEYEAGTILPEAITDLLKKYEGIISSICIETDKLDCFFTAMRREILNWFADRQKAVATNCWECRNYLSCPNAIVNDQFIHQGAIVDQKPCSAFELASKEASK